MRKAARISAAVAVVAGTSGLGIAGWGATPRASADAATEWSTSARADAMAIEYLNINAPVFRSEPVFYGTPASAASRRQASWPSDKFQIARVIALAGGALVSDGEPNRESPFTIGPILANGTQMRYDDGGVKYGDQKGQSPADHKPLFDALKQAGI